MQILLAKVFRRAASAFSAGRLALGCLALSSALEGCSPSAEVHYRVTVEVNDGRVVRSGSAVWAFSLVKSIFPLVGPFNSKFKGEAIPVVIPGRGILFALPASGSPGNAPYLGTVEMYPEELFRGDRKGQTTKERLRDLQLIARQIGRQAQFSCPVSEERGIVCPLLLRFRNISDARTIEPLSPEDLAEAFGSKVSFRRVIVTITDAPVTKTVHRLLPNFGSGSGYQEWLASLPLRDLRQLSRDEFIRVR